MEYALGELVCGVDEPITFVLILVVMEYALGDPLRCKSCYLSRSLNPCCNGICSRSGVWVGKKIKKSVLILVVMEYALGASIIFTIGQQFPVLILVVMEYALGDGSQFISTLVEVKS